MRSIDSWSLRLTAEESWKSPNNEFAARKRNRPMLKGMKLRNLTVFADVDLRFAGGLNVVVGANGTGKSHLLKAAYAVVAVSARGEKESGSAVPRKSYLESALAKKMRGVFRPDELGRLARRQAGRSRCEVAVSFIKPKSELAFSFNTSSKTEVAIDTLPAVWEESPPVFLPTRELLTIYPGFVSLYETTDLPFEETWRDTCILLGAPLARGGRLAEIRTLMAPLEATLGGKVDLADGRFYVRTGAGNMEAHLVAEGLRKLALIARLVATGSLIDKGYLFWDEPEANLNPKVIKQIARTILQLCRSGLQVFVASHSLFLMRDLDIQLQGE
jgi:predicted ATPase